MTSPHFCGNKGFTLTEILVSTAIIGFVITSVVIMTRKSQEINFTVLHRHTAQRMLDSCFESSAYDQENFDSLPSVTNAALIIDNRQGGTPLVAALNIGVNPDSAADKDGSMLYFKRCVAQISWNEPEGSEVLTMTRDIASLE